MIAIVDYGRGNLRSVEKGLTHVGADARIVSDEKSLDNARAIVLPGVGAFRDCMDNLREAGLGDLVFLDRGDVGAYVRWAGSPVVYTISTHIANQILKHEEHLVRDTEG